MAAASSSRARAGPPCEKSPLSVKGGCCRCCRAGDVCALLRPGLAHTARLGLGLALCALGWARAVGTWLRGRAGAPAAARWLPAPRAASPRSRIPLCPSAGTAGLGLPRPVLPRALGQGGDSGDSDSLATLGGVKLGTVLVRGWCQPSLPPGALLPAAARLPALCCELWHPELARVGWGTGCPQA